MIKRLLLRALVRTASLWPDKTYLRWRYRLEMGRGLDFDNCRTMNEKLQWLKINNRYPELTSLVDKIEVKDCIAERLGKEYVVPTLKIWDSPEQITQADIDALPDKFVIKTNHSGGNTGVAICKDKNLFNLEAVRDKMRRSFKDDIYRTYREWPYKNVRRRIFAEAYLGDDLTDYKFYCFNGKVDCVLLCYERNTPGKTKYYFFDRDWKLCRYNKAGIAAPEDFTLPKPDGMDRMFEIAAGLSKGYPMIRVDLYNISGRIYFGELTFFPASGFDPNRLPEADLKFGNQIDLTLARHEID